MKTNIKIPANSTRTRILSAFMAFLIFTLTFQQAFVNMGMRAKAAQYSAVTSTTTESSITSLKDKTGSTSHSGNSVTSNGDAFDYTYTGNLKPANATMFDYIADSNDIGKDKFQKLNTYISDECIEVDNPTHQITIKLKRSGTDYGAGDNIKAHLWCSDDDTYTTTWPGKLRDSYDSATDSFVWTFTYAEIPTTNSNKKFSSDYIPDRVIFSNDGSNQLVTMSQRLLEEHTYTFSTATKSLIEFGASNGGSSQGHTPMGDQVNSVYVHFWDGSGHTYGSAQTTNMSYVGWGGENNAYKLYTYEVDFSVLGFTPTGYCYCINNDSVWTQDINTTLTTNKKYEDHFWFWDERDGDEKLLNIWSNSNPSTYAGDSYNVTSTGPAPKYDVPLYFGAFADDSNAGNGYYTDLSQKPKDSRGNILSNFYWQPNVAVRDGDYSISVQGLVNGELTGGNITQHNSTTNTDVTLPYFDTTWAGNHPDVMTAYSTAQFPYYEVYANDNSKLRGFDSTGKNYDSTDRALFYQFNSKDANIYNVYFNGTNFIETDVPITYSPDPDFFPFNSSDSQPKNFGFGAKFEMKFYLNEDGMMALVDKDGNSKDNPVKVDTMFEFNGDDDLWVFIDGHLALDMGGAHSASSGFIDFRTRKAYANHAISFDTDNPNNVSGSGKPTGSVIEKNFSIDGVTGDANTDNQYNPKYEHTMTVFYMERGMFDSNLMIRFNFPLQPNYSKMKIREETSVRNVNEGLRDLTTKAAEKDVFKYTVTNTGTKPEDVTFGASKYPTHTNSIRDVFGIQTKVTSQTTTPTDSQAATKFTFAGATSNDAPVGGVTYNLVDEYAGLNSKKMAAGKTNSSGEFWLPQGTGCDLKTSASDVPDSFVKKSSAEFENQFGRYSTMTVEQDTTLYTAQSHDVGDSDPVTTYDTTGARGSVSTYYTTTKKIYSTDDFNESTGITTLHDFDSGNSFTFQNTTGSTTHQDDEDKDVQMTAYFTNTPRTGAITIKKEKLSQDTITPSNKTFDIKVRFENVFGVTGINADAGTDYTSIKYSVYNSSGLVDGKYSENMGESTVKIGNETKACGTVTLEVDQWAVIEGIPYGTKYNVYENEPTYKPDVYGDNTTVLIGTIDENHQAVTGNNVTVTNSSNWFKIEEVTDFSSVNAGLKSYTKTAAEKDVFKYTVSNSGTSDSDVVDSGLLSPTIDSNTRTINGATTKLTGQPVTYDTTGIYLDTSKDLGDGWTWDKNQAIVAYLFNGSGGKTYWMNEISDYLYRIETTGYNVTYTGIQFYSIASTYSESDFPKSQSPKYNGVGFVNRYMPAEFSPGATYKITGWGSGGTSVGQIDDEAPNPRPIVTSVTPAAHNYTPSVSGNTVSNTNYEWTDGFALPVTQFTGETDGTGSFYLMHGETVAAGGVASESSAKFYNQFAINSQMTVVQADTLTSPNVGDPDTLKANNRGAANTSLATYYTTKKELSGTASSNGVLAAGTNSFTYSNGNPNKSVQITETFTNTVKTGDLKITKAIEPTEGNTGNTTKAKAEFEFRITLKNVFGVTDNNVAKSDYQNITVSKTDETSYQLTNDGTNTYATFTLKAGQTLTIEDIPVGTRCEIQEVGQTGATQYYVFNNVSYTTDNGVNWSDPVTASSTIQYDVVADTTREYKYANKRNVGSLTLSKALTDAGYASTTVGNSTPFTFEVTLKEPIGVTFMDNYLTSEIPTGTTPTATDATTGQKTYTITKTVKAGDDPKVKIDGIPFGTEYTVTEVQHSTKPTPVYDEYATGTINSESTVTTQVTNKYRKVTLTKKDSKDTATALNGAKYVLLRLKSSALSSGSLTTAAINAFNAATESNYINNLESYYDDYSGILTTEQVDSSDGTIVVKDAGMTNGLRAGNYFFVELSPPADYNKNNDSAINYKNGNSTSSQNKIFTIADNDASNAHAINYYNVRKTGTLKLSKTLSGSYPASAEVGREFVYDVTITGPSGVNLGAFGVTGKYPNNNAINLGTLTDNSYHFTVTVHQEDTPLIKFENLPYGTTYSVYESSTLPACITTINNSSGSAVTGEIGEGSGKSVSPTATITNTYNYGTLNITKAFALDSGASYPSGTQSYIIRGTLSRPNDSEPLNKYSSLFERTNVTLGDYDSDNNTYPFTATISTTAGTSASASIANLPLGTAYTLSEDSRTDASTAGYTGTEGVTATSSDVSGTINSTNSIQTATVTNTYHKTVSLTLIKAKDGTPPSNAPASYNFNVTLRSDDIGFGNYTIKKTVGSTVTDITNDVKTSVTNDTYITVPVQVGTNVVISGLPADTTYLVVEDDASETGTVSPDGGTTAAVEGEMDSAVAVSTQSSHTITNHYPATYDLTLKKAKVGVLPSSIEANPKFKFDVTLEEPTGVDLTKYTITGATIGSPTNHVYSFSVYVPIDNNGVTIGGIPKGTKYTVSENDTTHYYTGSNNTQHNHPANTRISAPNSIAETELTDDATETITNTYPEVGSLTLSKSLVNEGNAATNHDSANDNNVNQDTEFIFKVVLSNPPADLREYLNNTTLASIAAPLTTYSLSESSCIVYIKVKKSDYPDNLKTLGNIPEGTTYDVTEVYNTSDDDMSHDPNNPHVTYSTAHGTISHSTVANATATNTYRQITMTKKDVKDNRVLSGAVYRLLKLKVKDGSNNTIDYTSQTVKDAFASALASNDVYTSLSAYYDGYSSELTTNASGQIVVRDPDITGGITDGPYFFFEVTPPSNYAKDNTIDGKIITVQSGTNNYDTVVYTDTRKTGTLTLKKTNTGTYKPTDYAAKGYTYHVKLTLPSEINPSDYTMKVGGSSGETLTSTPASTPTKYENLSISTNVYTFDVLDVKEQSGGSVEIYGIPYGTDYEVYEVTTGLPVCITTEMDGSTEAKKIKGTVNESNNSGAAEADITNTYLTGQLTLTKATSGNAPTEATTFTFTGKLEAVTGVDLSKYSITNITRSNYTDSNRKCDFTATVTVPAGQHTASIVIEGIPYGTQYIDVMEDETASSLPAGVTVNVTGGTGTSVSDKKASGTINSTNAAHTVTVDNSYPASGNLTITKQVVGTPPTSVGNSFEIHYTLNAPGSGTFSSYSITRKVGNGTEDSFEPQSGQEYSSTISDGQSIVIKGLPNDTTYTITEPHTVPSGVSWTTSLDSTLISDKTFNASTGASETITNTFPYTGTLTLSKELSGNDNAGSSDVDLDTPFTFKVTLKEPSGISFLNNYITSDIDSNTTYTEDRTTHQKTYTIYKTVKKSNTGATAVKIEDIPNGTVYTVTEVTNDTNHYPISDTDNGDSNRPSVTYSNTASGTIEATDSNVSVTATVTNTYRQITLTKKDSRDNHALNGAKYVLLKLKSGLTSEQKDALQALFADDVLPDNDTDFETYYTSQSFSTYCDGKSSIKSTNTISSEDGKLVLKSSEVDGGLTPGEYFLLALKAPDNYQRSNVLNGNIITIANNTTTTNYDDIVRTNIRKTGSLKLKKTVSGTTPSDAPVNYTFKVKLTKPSDLTDFSNYTIQKDSVNISPAVTSGTEFSVQVPANGTVVTLSNIPYGTTYEVYEDTTGFAYNVKSDYDGTSKLTGTVGETGTNPDDPANAEITNTYYTGDLVLEKELEAGTTDTTTKFTYHVELTNSDSSGIDLTKYISNPPSATGAAESIATITNTTDLTADTVYSAHKIAFDVKIIAGTNATISGIPYGTTYTVTEPDIPSAEWKNLTTSAQTDTIDNSDNPIVNNKTFTATITNGKVATLNLIVALANVAAPPASLEKNNTEFTFQVEMTAPQKMSGKDLKGKITIPDGKLVTNSEAYTVSPTANNGEYTDNDRKYLFEIKVSRNVPVLISDIPYNTQYKVQEKSPLPSTGVDNTSWTEIKEEYGLTTGTGSRSRNTTSTSASTITRPTDPHTISNPVQYFRAINAITGPMQITKKVTTSYLSSTSQLPANPSFSFKITLTSLPSGITESDLQYFTINNGAGEFTLLTDESDKKYLTANVAFSETPADNDTQSVTITGIPQGTTCLVEEINIPVNWTNSLSTGYNPTIGDTVATATASFTNEYEAPQSKSVTLHKESAETNSAMEGVQFYLLKLNASADPSNPSVAETFVNSENVSSLNTYATIVGGDSNILTTNASGDITVTESASFTPTAGDKYFFYEIAAPSGFIKDNSLTDVKIVTIEDGTDTYNITYTNSRPPSEVTVEKQDSSGNLLSDAVFDLYYQDTITPPAYTFNEPIVPPTKTTTVTVNGTKPSHPGLEDTTTTTTVTTYSYEYPSEPSLPSAEEADWILPRSDNDYIYFRDYNVGSPADHDKRSFANPEGSGNTSAAQDANRSWLRTDLKDNVETQHLEIDYDHRYWYAAQFSGSGKQDVQYAIWERFVDRYNGQDTVVWKIQPPDGYDYVRFCLYDGGQCIRTTEKIKFKLGQIWHKKDWGGMYKNENGNHCYFNVPLQQESDWAFYDGSPKDKRMDTWSDTTTMQQAIRYTPTEQKITFHCNSNQVWHNIHIEFFRDVEAGETADITIDGSNYMYVGQHFPGFMMEPYAYAGDNYRVGNYLTYELTIPKEAKYFRVNNGIDNSTNKGTFTATSSTNPAQSPYAYRSAVRQLKGSEENGRKNYDNYYSFGSSAINVSNSTSPVLHTWNSTPSSDNRSKTYSDKPVDSDYDYIYFEAPSNWGNHIYAYFYGGGDLRNDNWQRAVYSIWPGVAATATEYTASGSETGTSDIYKYPTEYGTTLNPESTYTDKNNLTVYKFRVPKGERKNYSKVIFNNGLKSQLSVNGGDGKLHETGVITFHRSYLYTSSGSSKLHNEATSTTSYEQRGDYLYIKNTAGWDDIHIKFYNSSGSQILQTGEGYVMDYSGKQSGTEYFRIAIPKNAAKFSLSTGKQYSDDGNTSIQTRKTTGKYDILRYAPTETDTDKSDYTKGNIVFDLTGTGTTGTLTKTYPNLVQTEHTETYSSTETAPSLDSISNSPRGDYIYIKDTADVMTNTTPTFSFKDAGGSALTSPVVLKLDKDSSNHRWYRVGIPTNAASFTINSGSVTYPVYPKSTSSTQQMNVTPGDMYFETATNTTLNLSWPTFTSNADDLSDEIFEDEDGTHPNGQRGDNLYLVHAESALSDRTGMTVTFYDAGGMPMENEKGDTKIRAKSLGLLTAPPTGQSLIDGSTTDNADAQGYWYRVAIPYGAATFTVSNADSTNTTPKADIFELRQKITRYSKDYTLGDMQYRLNGTATKLIYPIFTEVEDQTLEISEGQTIGGLCR